MKLLEKIITIVAEELAYDAARINETTTLVDDLGMTSSDAVSLALALQAEFGVEIADEDLEELQTVGDLLDLIQEQS
jgi:acyl carrier protein